MLDSDVVIAARSRILKPQALLNDARNLALWESWDSCANRLYYACYHSIHALLIVRNLNSKSHSGSIRLFHLTFVKSKELDENFGLLVAHLFDLRQLADYTDESGIGGEQIGEMITGVAAFISKVESIIESTGK